MLTIIVFVLFLLAVNDVAAYNKIPRKFDKVSRLLSTKIQTSSKVLKIPKRISRSIGNPSYNPGHYFTTPDEMPIDKTSSLWDHVVKMEQVILSVEFNKRHLNVWQENKHGYNRFYVTPLCMLETASINCSRDDYSNDERYVFSFNIKLWDSFAAETVKLALKQKGIEADPADILPLPMLQLRLGINQGVTDKIGVEKDWRSNQDQPNIFAFELYTKDEEFCEKMVKDARCNPEKFLARTKLYLEYTMVVGQKAYRSLNITGQTFVKSNFFSNLVNNYSDKNGMVLLSSSDLNNLARDIYRTASAQEEITSTYSPTNQERQIISELLEVIKGQTVQSASLTKDEWSSVFWNDIFSRPDVQTKYFNEALKYDEGEELFKYNETKDDEFREYIQNKHHHETENTKSKGFGFSFKGFGFNTSGTKSAKNNIDEENIKNSERINQNSMSKEELQKFLRKDNVNVRWSGTKFTPKNLDLYRLNAKSLKSSGEVLFKRIVLTKFASTQKIEIRPELRDLSDPDNSVSPVYYQELTTKMDNFEQRLKNITTKFEAKTDSIKQDATQLVLKTSDSDRQMFNEGLINVRNNFSTELANSNKLRTDADNHLTAQINEKSGQLATLQNQHNALQQSFTELNHWARVDHNIHHIHALAIRALWRSFKNAPNEITEEYKQVAGHYPS